MSAAGGMALSCDSCSLLTLITASPLLLRATHRVQSRRCRILRGRPHPLGRRGGCRHRCSGCVPPLMVTLLAQVLFGEQRPSATAVRAAPLRGLTHQYPPRTGMAWQRRSESSHCGSLLSFFGFLCCTSDRSGHAAMRAVTSAAAVAVVLLCAQICAVRTGTRARSISCCPLRTLSPLTPVAGRPLTVSETQCSRRGHKHYHHVSATESHYLYYTFMFS